jgi:acetyl esterase/lipase
MRAFPAVISLWLVFSAPSLSTAQAKPPLEFNLWEGQPTPGAAPDATHGADDGTGRFRNVGIPGMWVYLPEDSPSQPKAGRMAIVVCPGGGYTHLTRLAGADGAVNAFLPKNVAVISLKYRTLPPSSHISADTLEDGKRAVRLVRLHAKEWGIDPKKIGVLGWSAGANLALNLATHFDAGNADATDLAERQSSRPDFVVLLSPWPSKQTIADYPAREDSPPAFIGSAKDDKTAPVTFAEAIAESYKKAGAKASLWEVETGGHGAFTIDAPGEGGKWIGRFWPWLKEIGIGEP